jgi:hypothetical protein
MDIIHRRNLNRRTLISIAANGRVFVSGFALHNAQFGGQMLMAKLAQNTLLPAGAVN